MEEVLCEQTTNMWKAYSLKEPIKTIQRYGNTDGTIREWHLDDDDWERKTVADKPKANATVDVLSSMAAPESRGQERDRRKRG